MSPADLPANWSTSDDSVVTVIGDANGLHLLEADERNRYQWSTVATLATPVESDSWVGQACLTASRQHAVVVYAPRQATNDPVMSARGAWGAVVDMSNGRVHPLPIRTSLAYYNPGCGYGEHAVLTQEGDETVPGTRLSVIDAATATVTQTITTGVQVSSAVPTPSGIVGAGSGTLVEVAGSGAVTSIVKAAGVPYRLLVDGGGGVVHLDHVDGTARVRRTVGTTTTTLGQGPLTSVRTQPGADGHVYLAGAFTPQAALPAWESTAPDVTPGQTLSSRGTMAVAADAAPPSTRDTVRTISLRGRIRANGRSASFVVPSAGGSSPSPLPKAPATPKSAGSATSPIDADRSCFTPRNDSTQLVYQPTPRQIEWAADQAIRHALTVSRPANWHNDGLAAYTPQGLVPPPAATLTGGGYIPAQIMLGVMAQESNLNQASYHALSGEYGNPLVANFYGTDDTNPDPWAITFSDADCGYGVAQVTDGMRLGDTSRSAKQKTAIALDYATNIQAGVAILESKWNDLFGRQMKVNDANPALIENWYLALWAYNSGYHSVNDGSGDGTSYGLGWLNNPANPHYPADRAAFMDLTYADAAHPQDWPYQEKVIGFAGHPIDTVDGAGYRAASWTSTNNRATAQPAPNIACTTANDCQYGKKFTPNANDVSGEPAGPCAHKNSIGQYNLQCWWHSSITWKPSCTQSGNCGYELERFDPGQYPEQPDGTHYPPSCSSTSSGGALPSSAIVVDDIPATSPSLRCGSKPTTAGSFSFSFTGPTNGGYESKIDFHQIGGGYGSHFWFAHAEPAGSPLAVTGTWQAPNAMTGWVRVLVHIPDHGAASQQAHYRVWTGPSTVWDRYVPTDLQSNSWLNLGVFPLASGGYTPKVSLSNVTKDAEPGNVTNPVNNAAGFVDIAWDAAAFVRLATKPTDIVVQVGDSYASGEGAEPYSPVSDRGYPLVGLAQQDGIPSWNACRRSVNSWARKTTLPGRSATIGTLTDSNDATLDYHSVACSGAFTYNMDPNISRLPVYGALGQHHEMTQLDSGFLDVNTTLVVLTAGGNDAQFSQTVQTCANPLSSCPDQSTVFAQENAVQRPLTTLLTDIHSRAPNARVVLLGYPELFWGNGACGRSVMPASSFPKLNTFADHMASVQKNAVAAAVTASGSSLITFRWTNADFAGHRICDDEAQQGINDVVTGPTGPGDFQCTGLESWVCLSMESYHPNNKGTSVYASALRAALS